MYPKDFFAGEHEHVAQTAFVLMPFDSRFDHIFGSIHDAVIKAGFSSCRRADDVSRGGHIMAEVLKAIADAEVIIADVTGRNPNVFYELGITHTVKDIKSVFIIRQSNEEVPFDIGQLRHLPYEDSPSGLEELQHRIVKAVKEATPSDLRFNISEGETHTYPDRIPGLDRYLYEFDVNVRFTGRDFAKFFVTVRRHGNREGVEEVASEDYGLGVGECVTLPHFRWLLRLDHVVGKMAHFCLNEPVTAPHVSSTPSTPPTPPPTPTPDRCIFSVPAGWTFRAAVDALASQDRAVVEFLGFSDDELGAQVTPRLIETATLAEALQVLGGLAHSPQVRRYKVAFGAPKFTLTIIA